MEVVRFAVQEETLPEGRGVGPRAKRTGGIRGPQTQRLRFQGTGGALGIFLRINSSTTFLPSSSFKPGTRRE